MKKEKFTELVNLYLDKEISAEDLERMKAEISANPERQREFVERCRLHKAMRLVLEPGLQHYRGSAYARHGVFIPSWLLVSGVAASLVLGFMLLAPLNKSATSSGGNASWVDATWQKLSSEEDVTPLRKSELRRYASVQEQKQANPRASLVSQMRLIGLRPEHTPQDKQLERIDLAAIYEPVEQVNQAELFQRIQALKAIPQAELIQLNEADEMNFWSDMPEPIRVPLAEQPPIGGIEEL